MFRLLSALMQMLVAAGLYGQSAQSPACGEDTAFIRRTPDFLITGRGDDSAWSKTSWQNFIKIDSGGKNYRSQSKMLYSDKGLYLLFTGDDQKISTRNYKDDEEIYEGDVFEFFLQADSTKPAYFEYEINQLNRQLILILSGAPNKNIAWSPWGYEYKLNPAIQKKVVIGKGSKKPGAAIGGWTAEIFFPYEIFGLLPGVPPKSGSAWKGNFCRIDYDSGKMLQWSWSKKIKTSFHELENFGYIIFE
jgi:Carbohydrate-binding family 9